MDEARYDRGGTPPKKEYMLKKRKDGTYSILRQTDRGPIGMFHDLDKKAAERIMKKLDGASDARDRRERGIPDVKGKYAGQRLFASFQEHVDFAEETEEHIEENLEEMSAKAHYQKMVQQNKLGGKRVSPIDRERHPNREKEGLEGPFRSKKSGLIYYYDKKAGKYYDAQSDMYLQVSDIMEETQVDEIVRAKDIYPEIDKIKKVLKKKGIGFYTRLGKIMVNPSNVVEARSALNKAFGGQFEKKTGMEVAADKKQSLSDETELDEDKMLMDKAIELGRKAFKADKKRVPIKDPNLVSLKGFAKGKDKNEVMKQWLKGWDEMNLKDDVQLDEAVDQKQLLAIYKKLKKGDKIDVAFDSSIRKGKEPMTLIVTSPHRVVGKAKVGRIIFKSVDNMGGVKYFWYNRDDKISMAQGDMAISPTEIRMSTNEGFSSDAQRRAAFASGYKAKDKKDKKEEDTPVEEGKKIKFKIKLDPNKSMDKISNKLEDKMTDGDMDKREKIVKSMKKKKDDFKARYGDQADEVMYATATKMAMKESHEIDDVSSINESFDNEFPVSEVEILAANMTHVLRDPWVLKEAPFDDIQKVVSDKTMMNVKWPDGKMKVDLMTANVLMTVYDALNDKNKKKFAEKINAKMGNFMKLVQFAYSAVKPK